jgi:hypothetical protein
MCNVNAKDLHVHSMICVLYIVCSVRCTLCVGLDAAGRLSGLAGHERYGGTKKTRSRGEEHPVWRSLPEIGERGG